MIFSNQIKFVFFILVSFLILLSFHLWNILKDQSIALKETEKAGLSQISLLIMPEVEKIPLNPQTLTPLLKKWITQLGIDRLTVYDTKGAEISHASQGLEAPRFREELSRQDRDHILKGYTLTIHSEENGLWKMYIPIQMNESTVSGILHIQKQGKNLHAPEGSTATALFLKIFGIAGATVLGYSFLRSNLRSWTKNRFTAIGNPLPSEAGNKKAVSLDKESFVLSTFQSVVHELKEKEHELQRLKSLAEEKVRDIESYNENILRSVSSGVITFNPNMEITTYNLAAEKILGVQSQEAVGRSCEDVFGLNSPVYQLLNRALKEEQATARQEFEIQRNDHRKIWVGVSTSLLRDQRERVIGATFVFTDLTEIRRLQEQVELKKRLTVLGEMSAGIAHEFRNIMGTILGYSKLLSKQVGAHNPRQGMIDAIIQELKAMEHLIIELLNFSKNTDLNCQPLPLKPFLENIVNKISNSGEMDHSDVLLDIPENLPPVYGDEILLRQAFSNLAQNGMEAMENLGSLRLTARFIPPSTVEVLVQDSGSGIPAEDVERIFLPFFTTKEKGTGLGLALVHKIILSHNGRIEVKSQQGEGTTFHVYLPTLGPSR